MGLSKRVIAPKCLICVGSGGQHVFDPFDCFCAEFSHRIGVTATAALEHVKGVIGILNDMQCREAAEI